MAAPCRSVVKSLSIDIRRGRKSLELVHVKMPGAKRPWGYLCSLKVNSSAFFVGVDSSSGFE